MTTIALAEGFRVCQSFLGAKLHDAKDPGADLSAMLHQVTGSIFLLMQEYEPVWAARDGSAPVDLFGFRFDVGLDPIQVNLGRMLEAFARGVPDLAEVWSMALDAGTLREVRQLGIAASKEPGTFHLPDELWCRIIYDFARAHRDRPPERAHLLKSLTPLYLGRVASFVLEAEPLVAAEVEDRIESLCVEFERQKAYLKEQWGREPGSEPPAGSEPQASEETQEVSS